MGIMSAGQTPTQQLHPGRVNMGIAKSYKEVTQVEGQTLIRAKILPHIDWCRSWRIACWNDDFNLLHDMPAADEMCRTWWLCACTRRLRE